MRNSHNSQFQIIFRLLRIYGREYIDGTAVVTVYPMSGETPIDTLGVTLSDQGTPSDPILNPYGPDFLRSGPFARLDPITDAVRASGQARVRIEVRFAQPPRTTRR